MGSCNFPALCRNWCPVFQRPRLNQLHRSHKRPESGGNRATAPKMAVGMTFPKCGCTMLLPKKIRIFVRLPGGETKSMTHLVYSSLTTKYGSGSGPIAIQCTAPVSNLDWYASILRQQGRCRNGWWGQCQDPDQGATRHCDVQARFSLFYVPLKWFKPIFPISLLSIFWV